MWSWFVILAACLGSAPAPQLAGPPRGAAEVSVPDPVASTIAVPILVPRKVLETEVASKVPQVLLDTKNESIDKGMIADIRAERIGEPTVTTGNDQIVVEFPVQLTVKPRPGALPGGLTLRLPTLGEVTAKMAITVRLRPTVTDTWQLEPHAKVGHRWIDPPVLSFGPLRVDVSKLVNAKLAAELPAVGKELDRELPGDLDLRGKVRDVWRELGTPRQLNDAPATWLSFAPSALHLSTIRTSKRGVHLTAGATGVLAIVLGDTAPTVDVGPMPKKTPPPRGPSVKVAAPIHLPWSTMVEVLTEHAVGTRFTEALPTGGSATVTLVKVLDVYPSGTSVVVGVRLRGEAMGTNLTVDLWLAGRASLEDDALHVRDFDYVARSDSVWFDLAHDTLGDSIEARIAEQLVVPLGPHRDRLLRELNARLADEPPAELVRVRGAVTGAELLGVYITDEALVVRTAIEGDLAITVRQ